MKYMIHACNQRQWYVEQFLVPSLIEQGIKEEDIYVYLDTKLDGNLKSWVKSCHKAYEMWGNDENVWHLQDDVIIASYFRQYTEKYEENYYTVICGFTCKYDEGRGPGYGKVIDKMWWSFPCIRLNTSLMEEFVQWTFKRLWGNTQEFGHWIKHKKGDDLVFKVFMQEEHPNSSCLNISPNLVDHIDFLLNGSTVNVRKDFVRSIYWTEEDRVNNLKEKIFSSCN